MLGWTVFGLDLVLAERPFGRFHPVGLVGKLIGGLVRVFEPWMARSGALRYGLGVWLVILTLTLALGPLALALAWAGRVSPFLLGVLSVLAGYASVCLRELLNAAYRVLGALSKGELEEARGHLRALVGRETKGLTAAQAAGATLESLAENLCDAFVAPMLYFILGGPLCAFGYRVVNTLDSMVGYKRGVLKEFGWFSARLDDVLNWIPARLSALLIALTGFLGMGSVKGAFLALRQDARGHESPNAGYPEAAMAGLLGVRLGGVRVHPGKPGGQAVFWAKGKEPGVREVLDGIVSTFLAALLGMGVGSLFWAVWAWNG